MSETNEKKKERCFVIMPISDQGDYPAGHFTKVYEQIIKPSVVAAGYEAYRVDENNICDAIINKIFNAIQECPMAICDLSNRNPNVLYELGLRQAYDKPVVLIQDDKTDEIFDVSGISTVFYKSSRQYEDVLEARENIKRAILSTKEGKVNTLAKVIKVNAADFSQIEVSQDDRISIILEGIYSEIKKLKNREIAKNSIVLFEERESKKIIYMSVVCSDSTIIRQFKKEILKNVSGVEYINSVNKTDDMYDIFFHCFDNTSVIENLRLINEIVEQFDIEVFQWSST